jgi:hypothetical protein
MTSCILILSIIACDEDGVDKFRPTIASKTQFNVSPAKQAAAHLAWHVPWNIAPDAGVYSSDNAFTLSNVKTEPLETIKI